MGARTLDAAEGIAPRDMSASIVDATRDTKLHGRWLSAARLTFIAVATLYAALMVFSLVLHYEEFKDLSLVTPAERPYIVQGMAQLGLNSDFLATYFTGWIAIRAIGFLLIALLIIRAKRDDWLAMFVALFLISFGVGRTLGNIHAGAAWPLVSALLAAIGNISFAIFFYIFPNGHFLPKWTRWVALIVTVGLLASALAIDSPLSYNNWPWAPFAAATIAVLATAVVAQVYRFRISGRQERQQMKWVMLGSMGVLSQSIIYTVPTLIDPSLAWGSAPGEPGLVHELIAAPLYNIAFLMIPVSIGIAVLRYHLWNIDLIINRTLVYVPLTAILAGMYAGLIAFLQKVFIAVTGAQSDAAVVLTTLILTASFTPIKNALQSAVDKRFKDEPDSMARLKALGSELENSLYSVNRNNAARRLLDLAASAFSARSGAIYLTREGSLTLVHSIGEWSDNTALLTIPLQSGEERVGMLRLGERQDRPEYTEKETEILQKVAAQVAGSIA